ncbi:MAG: outer membrane beta-barrel protein [Ferruginibacter sp.]
MRKLLVIIIVFTAFPAFAQTPEKPKYNLADRAADHILFQISSDHWAGAPDSIDRHKSDLSRGGNIYIMLDKPFKGNPNLSFALGVGVGTSSMFFKRMLVQIESGNPILPFVSVDTTTYFKKYKLATSFLEVPLEFRYTSNPETPNRAFKAAIGIKGGLLLNAHTKGKTLKNSAGTVINNYTQKFLTKSYFNTSRFAATARVGYGLFSLFGAYNLTSIFKDGVAADMKLYQVGLTVSGL